MPSSPIPTTSATPIQGLVLVLGGVRSGKSLWAERELHTCATQNATQNATKNESQDKVYLATADTTHNDNELAERIAKHKARRDPSWQVIEESLNLTDAIQNQVPPAAPMLVDCLTLWLANFLEQGGELEPEVERLLGVLSARTGASILVSNEVGQGIIPTNALARAFVDASGRLHTALANRAERVVWVVAGLAQELKKS